MMAASSALRIPGAPFAAALFPAAAACAQVYPAKTIRVIVPFRPGGGNDIAAGILGAQLTKMHKQQVIVENRPGAGTIIGAEALVRSAPDGYTLMVTNNSEVVTLGKLIKPSGAKPE